MSAVAKPSTSPADETMAVPDAEVPAYGEGPVCVLFVDEPEEFGPPKIVACAHGTDVESAMHTYFEASQCDDVFCTMNVVTLGPGRVTIAYREPQ